MNAPHPRVLTTDENLLRTAHALREVRQRWRARHGRSGDLVQQEFPSLERIRDIARELRGILFPMRLGPAWLAREEEDSYVGGALAKVSVALREQVSLDLAQAHTQRSPQAHAALSASARQTRSEDIVQQLIERLPTLRETLDEDAEAAFRADPAAHSVDEVLLCYPGMLAVIHHRLAHVLFQMGSPLVARMLAEVAHAATGIDIHPGAEIGSGFFIDHGTGVVIGETTIIGQRVRLYQAVTLGAKRFEAEADGTLRKGAPRHPILEDDVVVYAGATILGRITVGRGSTVGGNVWLTHSVPAGSIVTQAGVQLGSAEPAPHTASNTLTTLSQPPR